MDKVKIVLEVLKKHHFWALVVVVLVVGILFYVSASADLKDQYGKRVQTLKTASNTVSNIIGQPDPANEKRIANWKTKREQQEKEVYEAWRKIYDEQKALFTWPTQLGQEFRKVVEEQLGPTEEIPKKYRFTYWNAIGKAVPGLLETVDYRRYVPIEPGEKREAASDETPAAPGQLPGRLPGTAQEDFKPVGTIDWKDDELKKIQDEFNWPTTPSSLWVRLRQENYWVYRALLAIISKTNGEAKTHSDAAIKSILVLRIGKAANDYFATNKSNIVPEIATTTGSGFESRGGSPGQMRNPAGLTVPGGRPGAGGDEPPETDDMLLDSRYVDRDMNPLTTEQTKNTPPFQEFNMMPMAMVLVIDQRRIPDLLVELANSTVPVEVTQVRVNPGNVRDTGSGIGGLGGGGLGGPSPPRPSGGRLEGPGAGGMRMPEGLGNYGPPGGGLGRDLGGGLPGAEESEASPYEATVEIRGIVYLYKPPTQAQTGTTDSGMPN